MFQKTINVASYKYKLLFALLITANKYFRWPPTRTPRSLGHLCVPYKIFALYIFVVKGENHEVLAPFIPSVKVCRTSFKYFCRSQ